MCDLVNTGFVPMYGFHYSADTLVDVLWESLPFLQVGTVYVFILVTRLIPTPTVCNLTLQ